MLTLAAGTILIKPIIQNLLPLLSTINISKYIPTFDIADFIKTFHPALPHLSEIDFSLPHISIPTLPQISIDMAPLFLTAQQLFSNATQTILGIIIILNPTPLIDYAISLIQQTNSYALTYVLWTTQILTIVATYFDPLPGIKILSGLFTYAALLVLNIAYKLALLVNPIPDMIKTWNLEITVCQTLIQSAIFLANVIGEGIGRVFSAIEEFFLALYAKISSFFYEIHLQIDALGNFLNPYVTYTINILKKCIHDLAYSFKSLTNISEKLIKQYNENQIKLPKKQ
jgi:hypothetical protein